MYVAYYILVTTFYHGAYSNVQNKKNIITERVYSMSQIIGGDLCPKLPYKNTGRFKFGNSVWD